MTLATQQLAEHIREHGPVPTVCFRPGQDRLWGLTFAYWTSARYVIRLDHGQPTLAQVGPTKYWVSLYFARKDAEEVAAKEGRLVCFYPPGPLDEETSRLVLDKLGKA